MMKILPFIVIALIVTASQGQRASDGSSTMEQQLKPLLSTVTSMVESVMESIKSLKQTVRKLSQQTMLQQFYIEEDRRTAEDSGIRVVAANSRGFQNYQSATHIGTSTIAIHDHPNYNATMGMGELSVVLNGVYFKTRHNDYRLHMASTSSKRYGATELLPFPEVPPEVLTKDTVEEQIVEMREWFRAFRNQDRSLRDYTQYFKPALCYLEGAWVLSDDIEEPFVSERHHLEANSWQDLQEKIRFSAYSGTKNSRENWASLPTTIMDINETTMEPVYAQWNYNILCHPIQRNIPLSMLKQVDDLSFRMAKGRIMKEVLRSKGARFQLYDESMSKTYQLLDEIFYRIPGKDNIVDDVCQQITFNDGPKYDSSVPGSTSLLNTCFYHRQYRLAKSSAMGLSTFPTGFNDANLWIAQTHQKQVAPMGIRRCKYSSARGKANKRKTPCTKEYNRFSYAIPLEIVYLTPLLRWNPYNFTMHQSLDIAAGEGRNGKDNPFLGVDPAHHYLTPEEFYKTSDNEDRDPADTSNGVATVLDPEGHVRRVKAAGPYVLLPGIPDLGRIRLRYPIAPISGEGSSVWKELNALKDLFHQQPKGNDMEKTAPVTVTFRMSMTLQEPPGPHSHQLTITYDQFLEMARNQSPINVTTSLNQGHTHDLTISTNRKRKIFLYTRCGTSTICWDGHPTRMYLLQRNEFTRL